MRATAAGRDLLAHGPAAYGLATTAAARAWVAQYRAFRAAPTISVTGRDFPVPMPGGLTLTAAGPNRRVCVIDRPAGRAVVTMTPRRRRHRARHPQAHRAHRRRRRRPRARRHPPGRYRVQAVLIGDGLRDRAPVIVRVRR